MIYYKSDGTDEAVRDPKQKLPVEEWLKKQGRFKHLFKKGNEHLIQHFQDEVDRRWNALLVKCGEEM